MVPPSPDPRSLETEEGDGPGPSTEALRPIETLPEEGFRLEVEASEKRSLLALAAAAEEWGADWQGGLSGGELILPVSSGLRHGEVRGRLDVARARVDRLEEPGRQMDGSALTLRVLGRDESLWFQAVVILAIAAAGGLVVMIFPFFPELLSLAPFGALMALAGWFLVVHRLRHHGPREFLERVRELAESPLTDEELRGADDPARETFDP